MCDANVQKPLSKKEMLLRAVIFAVAVVLVFLYLNAVFTIPNSDPNRRIETCERFVHQDHLRIERQPLCDRHALLHAAGKLMRVEIPLVTQAYQLKMLLRDLLELFLVFDAAYLQRILHVFLRARSRSI